MKKLSSWIIIFILVLAVLFFGYRLSIDTYHIEHHADSLTSSFMTWEIATWIINTWSTWVNNEAWDSTEDGIALMWMNPSSISGFAWLGTEPFWWIDFSGTNALFQDANTGNIYITGIVWPVMSGSEMIWSGNNLVMKLKLQTCSDGMSDNIYSWSLNLDVSGAIYNWCAIL